MDGLNAAHALHFSLKNMGRSLSSIIFSLLLTFFSSYTFAWPPEAAPELNFSNFEIDEAWREQADSGSTFNPVSLEYQKRFAVAVQAKCPQCAITELPDKYGVRKYRITLPGSWYFEITLDPGTIEVVSYPLTDDFQITMEHTLEELIWNTAAEVGLRPDVSGHLNFGVDSTFGTDSLLFYNFFTDYLNHSGLFQGVLLGYRDRKNSPHPQELATRQSSALRKILAEFNPKNQSMQSLASRIYKEAYYKSIAFGDGDTEPHEKYHAVNITSIAVPGTPWPRVELRAIPMQRSAYELRLFTHLFQKRIEFLKGRQGKVEYTAHLNYPPDEYESIEQFFRYVTESGLDWSDYRVLVPSKFGSLLTEFENRVGYKPRMTSRAVSEMCRAIFSGPKAPSPQNSPSAPQAPVPANWFRRLLSF